MFKSEFLLDDYELDYIIKYGPSKKVHLISCRKEKPESKYVAIFLDNNFNTILFLIGAIEIHENCNHPAILKFIGYNLNGFKDKAFPTLIYEYAQYGPYENLLEKLSYVEKLIIAYGTASAMSYLQQNEILHPCFSPSCILIDEKKYPKVSYIYFPLENDKESNIELDEARSNDVIQFGIVLYQLFVEPKKLYYEEESLLYQKIMNGELPTFQNNTLPILRNLIERCWSKNTEDQPLFSDISKELKEYTEYTEKLSKKEKEEFDIYIEIIDHHKTLIKKK